MVNAEFKKKLNRTDIKEHEHCHDITRNAFIVEVIIML